MTYVYKETGRETEIFDEDDDQGRPAVVVPVLVGETPKAHLHRVRTVLDAMNAAADEDAVAEARMASIRRLALRAIAANRIVAATNVSDLEDEVGAFERIHDMANDLTIDTQRALARGIGWLIGEEGMSSRISEVGADVFDQLIHGGATDDEIRRAFADATGVDLDASDGDDVSTITQHTGKGEQA